MENWSVKSVDGVDVNATPEVQAEQVQETPTAQETEQAVVEEAIQDNPSVQLEDDGVIKVNLDEPPKAEDETQEEVSAEATEASEEIDSPIEIINEAQTETVNEESQTIEAGVEQQPEAAIPTQEQEEVPQVQLPENVEKLVAFMEETGGTLEDYVRLNKDVSELDDIDVIKESYRQKYPHLDEEDISFKMDDKFLFDEDVDDERTIRSKKLAFKEELYNARKFLESNKEKYYADLVSRKQSDIPQEYQQAFEVAKSYKQAEETNKQLQAKFTQATESVFNQDFKGFDFKLGDNTYRYKVNDPGKTKEYQSDLNNFIGEFLGDDGSITDATGYHKAMFAAKNVDKIAQHFYEQGRAEALKQSAREAKNISMDPRADFSADVTTKGGTKVRVVDNDGFNGKLKLKNYNNR